MGLENITIGNEFLNGAGANTATLPQSDNFIPKEILNFSAQVHKENADKLAAQQKQMADNLKTFNPDENGLYTPDKDYIDKGISEYNDWVKQHPESLLDDAKYLPLKQQRQRLENKILFDIHKNKKDYEWYNQSKDFVNKNFDKGYGQEHLDYLEQWMNTPPDKRGVLNIPAPDIENAILDQTAIKTNVPDKEYVGKEKTGAGNQYQSTTIIGKDPQVLANEIVTQYQSPQGQRLADPFNAKIIEKEKNANDLYKISNGTQGAPPQQMFVPDFKERIPVENDKGEITDYKLSGQMMNIADMTPAQLFVAKRSAPFVSAKTVKNEKSGSITSSGDGSGGGGNDGGSDLWQVKYVNDIFGDNVTGQYNVGVAGKTTSTTEPNSGYKKVSTDVDNSTFYPTPSTFFDTGSDGTTKRMVVGIIKAPDGSYYKAHEDEVTIDENNPSGYTYTLSDIVNPKNKITNYWLQVIKPNTGTQKQLDDAAADLWANQPEKAKQWGVPKPIGMNEPTQSSGTQQQGGVKSGKGTFMEWKTKNPNGTFTDYINAK